MEEESEEKKQLQKALNMAFFFLKFRPRTQKEVRDYLLKKAKRFFWSEGVIDEVIASLKEKNFLDDAAFVQWFVEQRNAGKPKSQFAIRHELQRFGIEKEIIDVFFQENPSEEESLAYQALARRWPRLLHLEKKERFQKSAMFLSGRGFQFETIKKTVHKLEEAE